MVVGNEDNYSSVTRKKEKKKEKNSLRQSICNFFYLLQSPKWKKNRIGYE